MKHSKEELEKIQTRTANQLRIIRDTERREEVEAHIGKCFRYRNSYSMPNKPSDYWFIYFRVIGTAQYGNALCFRFQTDKYGEFILHPKYATGLNHLGQEISEKQFFKELHKARDRVAMCMDDILSLQA